MAGSLTMMQGLSVREEFGERKERQTTGDAKKMFLL